MHLTAQKYKRRFLVPSLKRLPAVEQGTRLSQGFLVRDELSEVSVTAVGNRFSLRTDSRQFPGRNEVRVPISSRQFDSLWPLTEGRRVEKVRHLTSIGDFLAELDVYEGSLSPLCMATVEFPSESAASDFNPPEYAIFPWPPTDCRPRSGRIIRSAPCLT
jgi:adenylate cyclase